MGNVKAIENAVESLPPMEVAELRSGSSSSMALCGIGKSSEMPAPASLTGWRKAFQAAQAR